MTQGTVHKELPPEFVDQARAALNKVVESDVLASSPRLRQFLTYVVEETLSGHGDEIRGKAIAVEVYGRRLDGDGGGLGLVRVEAGRLRRLLREYYEGEGAGDDIRILIPTGGYKPTLTAVHAPLTLPEESGPQTTEPGHKHSGSRKWMVALGALFVALIASVFFATDLRPALTQNATDNNSAKLAALRERSMPSVQATNLAEQTRGMFFPLFDLKRQEIALTAFRHAIDLDPDLPSGYAGAAQILALLAYLSDDATRASELLAEASSMAESALERGPTDGWAKATMGWTLAVSGDTEAALRRARIAVDLSPEDGHVLDLVGITAIISNDPILAAEVSDPERPRLGSGRFGANSIWGTSQLMLQNYPACIEAFSMAAERGLPVSAPSLMMLATAQHENGEHAAARRAIDEMHRTWSGFPAKKVASRFFEHAPETLSSVIETLETYGSNL
ncbi:hypothetical protein SAMN04488026_11593 [Aliiruegeria lutimaris]|uniref:Tetratricopeptide repeat-containing protein n=1 Tax=Aliiruegeria lutimaris TaxID=571298 RepID=A0A1G9Q727_9RHOB|nr:hypothetical protein SAMN04488026_11593 [Aliiruegeria lutimaris]